MSAELGHVVEQFTLAVSELAVGRGALDERLTDAWVHMLTVQAHEIPEPLRPQFETMEAVWLSSEASDLDNDAVEEAARAILRMHVELLTSLRRTDR